MNRYSAIVTLLLLAVTACHRYDNYTVIVSLDGNRWDYPER